MIETSVDRDIEMTHRIAEILNEKGMDASDAEPVLWMLLSSIYRIIKKRHGIPMDVVVSLIDDHKKTVLKEMSYDVDKKLEVLL